MFENLRSRRWIVRLAIQALATSEPYSIRRRWTQKCLLEDNLNHNHHEGAYFHLFTVSCRLFIEA